MIEAIAIGLGVIWLGYKWVIKRQIKYITLAIMLMVIQLSRWPLFLDHNLVFGLLGIVGGVMMSVEFFIKKQITLVYPYIVILLGIGGVMLGYFFLEQH